MTGLPASRRTLSRHSDFTGQHEIDDGKVERYADRMRLGEQFPPVRVVALADAFLIVDGHHRVAASRAARVDIDAWVVDEEAFEDFDAANRHLGRRADDAEFWPSIVA